MVRIAFFLTLLAAAPHSAQPASQATLDRNKAVARLIFDEILGHDWRVDLVDRIHTPNFVAHTREGNVGLKEDRDAVLGWKTAVPDLTMTVDDIVAEGDRVVVRWTGAGTNTGEGNGLPATGRKAVASGITIFRMQDGRIAEEWTIVDNLSFLRQLGLLPEK